MYVLNLPSSASGAARLSYIYREFLVSRLLGSRQSMGYGQAMEGVKEERQTNMRTASRCSGPQQGVSEGGPLRVANWAGARPDLDFRLPD
jgi:hypothetical protein